MGKKLKRSGKKKDDKAYWKKVQNQQKKWYEKNKRLDEIVIPEDIRNMLGDEKFIQAGGKLTKTNRKPPVITANCTIYLKNKINLNKGLLPKKLSSKILDPDKHQHVADMLIGCTVVDMWESMCLKTEKVPDITKRTDALKALIINSKGSAHTNYQFVRSFTRRNLAALLKANKIDLSKFRKLFPPDVIRDLKKGHAHKVCEWTASLIKKNATPFIISMAGSLAAMGIRNILTCGNLFKGEFTHYEELAPVILALQEKGINFRIGVVVCKPDRFEYIEHKLKSESKTVAVAHIDSKIFRYYIFPREYIIMIPGPGKQFTIFWGDTQKQKIKTNRLLVCDWNAAARDGVITIVDE